MRIVVAADKFKGSLSAAEVAAHVSAGLRSVVGDAEIVVVPVADGGDGTVAAAVTAGFEPVTRTVDGPTGEPVVATYARRDGIAVVELADACGLVRLPGGKLDALGASSFGLGQMLAAALDDGAHRVIVGIGGSASTDGGAGMVQALGVRVSDAAGRPVARGGAALVDVASVDRHDRLATNADIVVACDVSNPLFGPDGAAAVYGPQKGAGPADVERLDSALRHWASVVSAATGVDRSATPGAGAAGGVGFAAVALLGAQLRSGIGLLLDLVGFDAALAGTDLVITGEGSLDEQTLSGKAPAGVAAAARHRGVEVVAVAGRSLLDDDQLAAAGIAHAYALTDVEPDVGRCLTEAGPLLETVGARIARDWLAAHAESVMS